MRVGLSTRTIEPALTQGLDGIGVYTAALAAHLPPLGVQVSGYAFAEAGRPALQQSRYLPHSYRWYLAHGLVGSPARVRAPVDIFHFTDYRVAPCAVPSVATVHDAIALKYPEWVSPRLRRLKNIVLKKMVGKADLFVAVSQFAVQELQEYFGLPLDRIRVVPCGIDESWLAPADPQDAGLRERHGIPASPYFLFVGTFQPRKNLERIIAAYLALHVDIREQHPLLIIGKPGWDCAQTVATLENAIAVGHNIVWLPGLRERSALRAAYTGALALVFPTLYEGFGIPVVEAFASRTPVLTARAGSLPEVAGDAAVLVDPYRAEEISDAMTRLANDAGLRRTLAEAGYRRAGTFTWQQTAARLKNVYQELSPRR